MSTDENKISLDLFIRRSPSSVKRWWTELPTEYVASDPKEQPFRIITTSKGTNQSRSRELVCYWRSPDGSERQTLETMYILEDDNESSRWAFDVIHPAGLNIRDDFRAVSVQGGTRLEIRSKLTPNKPEAEAIIPTQKERMIHVWKSMVELCERDAPP